MRFFFLLLLSDLLWRRSGGRAAEDCTWQHSMDLTHTHTHTQLESVTGAHTQIVQMVGRFGFGFGFRVPRIQLTEAKHLSRPYYNVCYRDDDSRRDWAWKEWMKSLRLQERGSRSTSLPLPWLAREHEAASMDTDSSLQLRTAAKKKERKEGDHYSQ